MSNNDVGVVSAGGTRLNRNASGVFTSETGWSSSQRFNSADELTLLCSGLGSGNRFF